MYTVGASMLVLRDFLEKVGLLDESYFLYYEENDWARRGKQHFQIGMAVKSIVCSTQKGQERRPGRVLLNASRHVQTPTGYPIDFCFSTGTFHAIWLATISPLSRCCFAESFLEHGECWR